MATPENGQNKDNPGAEAYNEWSPTQSVDYVAIRRNPWRRVLQYLFDHLNFFRIHLLAFTFIPLLFSFIFYPSYGRYKISYIDSLVICYSAFTNTGLSPVDMSRLTTFQQALIFIQMFFGSVIVVSWCMAFSRIKMITETFDQERLKFIRETALRHRALQLVRSKTFGAPTKSNPDPEAGASSTTAGGLKKHEAKRSKTFGRVRAFSKSLIRRMSTDLKAVDPTGAIRESQDARPEIVLQDQDGIQQPGVFMESPKAIPGQLEDRRSVVSFEIPQNSPPVDYFENSYLSSPVQISPAPRSPRNVDFAPTPESIPKDRNVPNTAVSSAFNHQHQTAPGIRHRGHDANRQATYSEVNRRPRPKRQNEALIVPEYDHRFSAKNPNVGIGLGGFPGPIGISKRIFSALFPQTKQKLHHTITINTTKTYGSGPKEAPYVDFELITGKNSSVHGLTPDHLNQLNSAEYCALRVLLWVVALYYLCFQALGISVFVPTLAESRWSEIFASQVRTDVRPQWAGVFLSTSAMTNSGFSLIDTSMVKLQEAHGLLVIAALLIVAGDTGFPILLRFVIWLLTKILPKDGHAYKGAYFLLDHPRRCFIYLFPSHQTWFLLTVIIGLNLIDWFGFLVLDIGIEAVESIPIRSRVAMGLLQAVSVRCAGFATIGLTALAPAVLVMYFVMMYIAPYPIAMAVRSTNVYEDKALGVYEESDDEQSDSDSEIWDKEKEFEKSTAPRTKVWGNYLAWHARRQLAFDIWWLAFALFLIAVFERRKIMDPELPLFNLFTIMFELVSAYGSIGLSIGLPNENFSTTGAFTPASKLVVILVMIRSRHRGLPVAIDRAVMLPKKPMEANANMNASGGGARQANHKEGKQNDLGETHGEKGTEMNGSGANAGLGLGLEPIT